MSGILNALDKKEALSIFNKLLQENKAFAFNTLDCIYPTLTLFKILFNQLNSQQKEDYKVNLETKSTVKAKYTLREFYLNNKESLNNLSTENSNEPLVQNRDDLLAAHFSLISLPSEETVVEHPFDSRPDFSYENEPLVHKRKRDDLNEFSELSLKNFLPSFATLEQIVAECEFDNGIDEISTVEPPAKRQCISVIPFPGFAEFHNQFSNIVKEDSTANDSSVPEEHTSLEGELTFLDSQINGGEPLTSLQSSNVNPLPEFSFSLSSVTLDEMVKRYGFNHNDHALSDLEEVYVEQPAKFHTYYHNN